MKHRKCNTVMETAAKKHPPRNGMNTVYRKEFEFQGCVEVPMELSEDQFLDRFLMFIEENGWSFGGGVRTIVDGYYINGDGTRGEPVCRKKILYDQASEELIEDKMILPRGITVFWNVDPESPL